MTLTGKQTHWCQDSKSQSTSKCLVTCSQIAPVLKTELSQPWESTQIMSQCTRMPSLKLTRICGISKKMLLEMEPIILPLENVLKTKLMLRLPNMEDLSWVKLTFFNWKTMESLPSRNNSRPSPLSIERSTDNSWSITRSSQPKLTKKMHKIWNRLSSMMLIQRHLSKTRSLVPNSWLLIRPELQTAMLASNGTRAAKPSLQTRHCSHTWTSNPYSHKPWRANSMLFLITLEDLQATSSPTQSKSEWQKMIPKLSLKCFHRTCPSKVTLIASMQRLIPPRFLELKKFAPSLKIWSTSNCNKTTSRMSLPWGRDPLKLRKWRWILLVSTLKGSLVWKDTNQSCWRRPPKNLWWITKPFGQYLLPSTTLCLRLRKSGSFKIQMNAKTKQDCFKSKSQLLNPKTPNWSTSIFCSRLLTRSRWLEPFGSLLRRCLLDQLLRWLTHLTILLPILENVNSSKNPTITLFRLR